MQAVVCRKNRLGKELISRGLTSKMADYKEKTADVTSGDMIFQPILEDGIFRFDCSANDRDAAFPSLSFINSKDRDKPITGHKVPLYTPTFEFPFGRQIVKIEVSYYCVMVCPQRAVKYFPSNILQQIHCFCLFSAATSRLT